MNSLFRGLDDDFMHELKRGKLHFILDFERKHRKSLIVEIRNNFIELYFLGHAIEVRRRKTGYYFTASNQFTPVNGLPATRSKLIEKYGDGKWQLAADQIKVYEEFEEIMKAVISRIVIHKMGGISEGVSEVNHFIDNRAIGKNGILIIDRQVVYPKSEKVRIDLLGLRRLPSGKFTFSVIELKNKNNKEIESVFSRQLIRYIDLVYAKYDDFSETYMEVLRQKIALGLLKPIDCKMALKSEISKKIIEGIVILDNYNIKSDLKPNGLLGRALRDWSNVGISYTTKLFLKTNVFDNTFFYDLPEAKRLLSKYKLCN